MVAELCQSYIRGQGLYCVILTVEAKSFHSESEPKRYFSPIRNLMAPPKKISFNISLNSIMGRVSGYVTSNMETEVTISTQSSYVNEHLTSGTRDTGISVIITPTYNPYETVEQQGSTSRRMETGSTEEMFPDLPTVQEAIEQMATHPTRGTQTLSPPTTRTTSSTTSSEPALGTGYSLKVPSGPLPDDTTGQLQSMNPVIFSPTFGRQNHLPTGSTLTSSGHETLGYGQRPSFLSARLELERQNASAAWDRTSTSTATTHCQK